MEQWRNFIISVLKNNATLHKGFQDPTILTDIGISFGEGLSECI